MTNDGIPVSLPNLISRRAAVFERREVLRAWEKRLDADVDCLETPAFRPSS
jgi:hypothetical protein